eukprot:TRINITY_DN3630_c0_g1_i1.p1 TRINITY_DN3630_c0_g1~~TRINITY_DN3630_c0_g1_i1.p1  ORF type:complete len:599 (+),score=113.91 TRINITY_DN3630_c0_g1_i1:44-1840(+)
MLVTSCKRGMTLSIIRAINNTVILGAEAARISGTIAGTVASQVVKGTGVDKVICDPRDELMRMVSNGGNPLSVFSSPAKIDAPSVEVRVLREEIRQLREENNVVLQALHDNQKQIDQLLQLVEQKQQQTAPIVAATDAVIELKKPQKVLSTSSVPSTQFSRATKMTTLAARLAINASWRKVAGKGSDPGVLSNKALDLLVDRLCQMRGAALKLGQLLSIQDQGLVPPHVLEAFKRVRDQTYVMPQWQMEAAMSAELGAGWESKFKTFNKDAVAAASLGQVHKATLVDGREVAVKIQFEGVSESITSDVRNLRWLFSFGILPKGLYVDNILKELQRELQRECDYVGEATRHKQYKDLLESDPERHGDLHNINVPNVVSDLSTGKVLTTEWVNGLASDTLFEASQTIRNTVGASFLRLTLKELFDWRFMQTDPSFANFLYDYDNEVLNLIDFGAAREFSKDFIETYLLIVYGSSVGDREAVLKNSQKLGLLTGEECPEMLSSHVEAARIASIPFMQRGMLDFKEFDISAQMKPHVATMLRLRLTAPPLEVYSLHRRLNGCFQFMHKLGAVVDCRRVFVDVLRSISPNLSEPTRNSISLKY